MPISLNCQFADLNMNTLAFASKIQEYLYSAGKYIVEVKPPIINPPQTPHPQSEIHIKDVDSGELRCRIWTNLGSMNTLLVVAKYMDGSKYGVDLYSSSNTSRSYANLVEEAHRLVKHFNLAVENHSKK